MQHLVDGDPAANNGGWQWTAGVGTDAAPYFRIFNPILQSKKFDPQGDLPAALAARIGACAGRAIIHEPWTMPRAKSKLRLAAASASTTPPPCQSLAARDRTLAAYKAARIRRPPSPS